MPMDKFMKLMNDKGILFAPFGPQTVRFVTHLDITEEMLEKTLKVISGI